MEHHDLIIIGGGPAGLTAAVYAARYNQDVLLLSREFGGTAATAHKICNFPSYTEISGLELTQKMVKQVEELKVPTKYTNVVSIKKEDDLFIIKSDSNKEYSSKKIIWAVGTKRRKLDVKGETQFLGKGVSYCATCDSAFFKEKTVAVIGGSNAALTAALLLSEYSKKVYLIYRRDKFFRAEPKWVESVEENKKIEVLFNNEITEIFGEKNVGGVKLKSNGELKLEGVFIEVGSVPDNSLISELGVELDRGFIKTNEHQGTNIKGVYAAGDCTTGSAMFQQVITAAAEGAIAAYSTYKES